MFIDLSKSAHWFLRIAVGSVFLYHGLGKFPQLNQMSAMMKMPVVMVFILASMEVLGAFMVLAGGFLKSWITRLGAVLLIPIMLGAIFKMHWGRWSFVSSETHPMGGIEFQVTLMLILLYLLVKGNKS